MDLVVYWCRYNSRRERTKFKKALQKAEWVERMAAKAARTQALEEEEAKKIPYEVMVPGCARKCQDLPYVTWSS